MFDERGADFSGMREKKDVVKKRLYVGLIRQKAFIEVNEVGTEAAAVTGELHYSSIDGTIFFKLLSSQSLQNV